MKKLAGYIIIFILTIISAGFFCLQGARAGQNILINEIMYDLKGADDKHEWIEIYNSGTEAIDLTGWKLNDGDNATNHTLNPPPKNGSRGSMIIPAGGFILLAGDAETLIKDLPNYSGTIIDTIISLNNTSAQLKLLNNEGIEITGISYNKNLGANGNGKTLEWDGNVFKESLSEGGTAGALNSILSSVPPTAPPAENGSATSTPAPTDNTATTTELTNPPNPLPARTTGVQSGGYQGGIKINFGDVVINELVSDPADNEVEWLELYNKTGREIDLTGWRLEDGSGAKTKLNGILAANGAERHKIIEQPAGNLNNGGDLIILYDPDEKIIDRLAYGNWGDGSTEDNAPAAGDPDSLARKFDGYNTYNNSNDFSATLKPTKGSSNIIQAETEASAVDKAKFDFSNDIFISEILPNPVGDDAKLEFIEIYNAGQRQVDLTGWSLSNGSNKKINLEKIATSTLIQAGEYLAFFRPRTKIVLPNDQGQVKLFRPLADKPLIAVDYKNVKEGWSYNLENPPTPLYQGGEGEWSETPTPGSANIIKTINHAPEVDFSFKSPALSGVPVIFDGSDTVDQDGDKLAYGWDFGDGLKNNLANPEHVYLKSGIYKVRLEVNDGKETAEKEKNIKVISEIGGVGNKKTSLSADPPLTPLYKGGENKVIINEIFPNPKGADAGGEWLELKNQGPGQINFLNWRVKNSNGKYEFKSEQLLDSGVFYVLKNSQSQLTFKNTDDVINLYDGLDELVNQVEYAGAVQGESYARGDNGRWFWTTAATPGAANVIKVADSQARIMNNELRIKGQADIYLEIDLKKVRELEIGSLIKLKGTVAVEPGILGAQLFYIVGSPGLQVYNYKKDFPVLKIGDYIEVTGELTQSQGELRLKTKDQSGIKITGHKPPPAALAISSDQANEEMAGRLVTVTGEITDKKSSTLYLDDGYDEILVYIKKNTGITTKNLALGQSVAITGILSKTSAGLRLLPRYQSDIVKLNQGQTNILAPQVLGEVATAGEWDLAERNKKLELFKYLLIIAGGVIIILVGLFIKVKMKV